MIIGRGLIAGAFEKINNHTDVVVFASGISNSKTLEQKDKDRELDLLASTINDNHGKKTLVYFSTYSVDSVTEMNREYVGHKLDMENYIKSHEKNYLIIRTSNIVGSKGNNATVFRYLFNKVNSGEQFELWTRSYRNLLDVDHLAAMVNELIKLKKHNCTEYLVNPEDINVLDLLKIIEEFTGKQARYEANENKASRIITDKTISKELFSKLNINSENYIKNLLTKYYSGEKG